MTAPLRPVIRVHLNKRGRDFVVGDIHGCFDQLMRLLNIAQFEPGKDRLFGCGDYGDRGPKSLAVVRALFRLFNCAVRGNHEDLAIQYKLALDTDPKRAGYMIENYTANGGSWFIELPDAEQREVVNIYNALPYAIEIELPEGKRAGIVHAEVPNDDWAFFTHWMEIADKDAVGWDHVDHYALWGRSIVRERVRDFKGVHGIDDVYVGHTVVKEPIQLGNVHYMDTGCYRTRKLSMVCLQTNEVFHT